jgi:hypothetical protein
MVFCGYKPQRDVVKLTLPRYGSGSRNCATCRFWVRPEIPRFVGALLLLIVTKVLAAGCRPGLPDLGIQYFNPRPCISEEAAESGRFVSLARFCCSCKLRPFRVTPRDSPPTNFPHLHLLGVSYQLEFTSAVRLGTIRCCRLISST